MPPLPRRYRKKVRKSKRTVRRNSRAVQTVAKAIQRLPGPYGVIGDALMMSNASTQTKKSGSKGLAGHVGYLAGKEKKIPPLKRKLVTKKGLPTQYAIAKNGITLNYESRKTVTGEEAIAIGHTTMPGKVCAINIWRAVFKKFMMDGLKLFIKDYGNNMVGLGFVVGDVFRINRFGAGDATTTNSETFTVGTNSTFDSIPALIAANYDDATSISDDRWDSIEFLPQPTSRFAGANMNLVNMKIRVYTKSILKVQNLTVENTADNEADDVNKVVLSGKLYKCKGNNFVTKANSRLLDGLFDSFNEEALFGAYGYQVASNIGGTSVMYYDGDGAGNDTDTVFYKPAEPPKFWEIQNCIGEKKLTCGPGGS